jgi:manganese transport protein
MPKMLTFRRGLSSLLLWSVISAAFIGPGTVTTASKAGAEYQLQLLWALSFATLAAIVLQEAAARVTIASGKNLGEILAIRHGEAGLRISLLLFAVVAFGCAAYEAGNVLGAVAGLQLLWSAPAFLLTLLVVLPAALLLWLGRFQWVARLMGLVVFLMGIAFTISAFSTPLSGGMLLKGALAPTIPEGSLLMVAGLIGTTIVPYNLFLASGIGQGQSVAEMRTGLVMAILIGGIISMAILLVGTRVTGAYSYTAVGVSLADRIGAWGTYLFGAGLFAAGATSAITAPLAASITARSLFAHHQRWRPAYFHWVWLFVLCVGLIFGLLDVRPIPAIIIAQALNGILLPFVTAFLFLVVNDRHLLPGQYANGHLSNMLMLLVFIVVCMLGLQNIWKSLSVIFPVLEQLALVLVWSGQFMLTLLATGFLLYKVRQG